MDVSMNIPMHYYTRDLAGHIDDPLKQLREHLEIIVVDGLLHKDLKFDQSLSPYHNY